MICQGLNKFLREKRRENGYKQKDVAKLLNLSSPQFISNYERNICNVPFPMLQNLIQLYKLDLQEVVDIMVKDHKNHILQNLGQATEEEHHNAKLYDYAPAGDPQEVYALAHNQAFALSYSG